MPDAGDRAAMLSLALIVVVAVAAGWWNWHDVLGHRAETTAAFLELSLRRLERMRWALKAGVVTLAAEVVIFGTWIPSRRRSRERCWSCWRGAPPPSCWPPVAGPIARQTGSTPCSAKSWELIGPSRMAPVVVRRGSQTDDSRPAWA
jgi:hypothetical protein